MQKILIIEDDPAIAAGVAAALRAEHYDVLVEHDGEQGFRIAGKEALDCILLDLMLPTKNGQEICRDLRAAGVHTPIIMLTSKSDELDKIIGLELGADDYVTKPFSVRELMARVKALLRRASDTAKEIDAFAFGDVQVDFKKMELKKSGEEMKLSAKEFEILKYFIGHESEVVTRDMLLNEVWGYEHFPTTRTVDNYILSLRKKIETDPAAPQHLITIHTAGYKFLKL